MTLDRYISSLNQRYALGNATEHTFRGDLQQLIESLAPAIRATNEPKRQACGAPDFILTKKDIPVGFIEAKDIGDKDLEGAKKNGNKEQFDRYKAALGNLIFTDYLDFRLYIDGVFIAKIALGEVQKGAIVALPENFAAFENLIKDFCAHTGQTIKSPKKLAEMMAGKARLLAGVLSNALIGDEKNKENSSLKEQMTAFRQILIHDTTPEAFADVYAQTLAYGMFAARLRDEPGSQGFSRQKAAELIPKSNPFLRKLFGYIAGPDIDDRIKWIVDGLADIFLASDVKEILKGYGKATKTEDPIIHFYETFLSEYDPALRKARGVWYTPAPVVNFIVRAVDDILKTEFNLPDGLADNSIVEPQGLRLDVPPLGNLPPAHKVQILDPAAGTGTFLAEVVKHIHKKFERKQGIWASYVENHLLPRLNGFELLMASYAMAHLQMDLLLAETGYLNVSDQRLRVFLTNSLEESHPDTTTLFAGWLSDEANAANHIKRDAPVMCVIGNPPYSGESSNKGAWIMGLMEDYKKEPGGKEKLKERNPKWINDDYVKFLRCGQYFIEKNGSGVLAFINPHGFLDNPTFRGMRWNLLKTYDKIYTIDLHGNAKKKETAPDGSPDANVFDIMQGVSINLFVKTGKKKPGELGKVFHFDLFGKREFKYEFLLKNSIHSVLYKELPNIAPDYFFVNKNFDDQKEYDQFFAVNEIFTVNSVGIVTAKDDVLIDGSKIKLLDNVSSYYKIEADPSKAQAIAYRPFDSRFVYYDANLIERSRVNVMRNFLKGGNIGLVFKLGNAESNSVAAMVTDKITDFRSWSRSGMQGGDYVAPLYVYPEERKSTPGLFGSKKEQKKQELLCALKEAKAHYKQIKEFFDKTVVPFYQAIGKPDSKHTKLFEEHKSTCEKAEANVEALETKLQALDAPNAPAENPETEARIPNLNASIIKQFSDTLGLEFVPEKTEHSSSIIHNSFAPIDVLDYVYAVLHSPAYREKYQEFLKTDFPKVPYPKNKEVFWFLVEIGTKLREIHLLESPLIEKNLVQYPISGSNLVSKPMYANGKAFINETQYFDGVPQLAWEFYIGGYQPAQKWLKDRKGLNLGADEISHYQKLISALEETDRMMKEIDLKVKSEK